MLIVMITMINGLLFLSSSLLQQQVFADSLRNAIRQRIGNYDMEMKTDPLIPIAGQNTGILLRISGVNGDDLIDLPIVIRIAKHEVELESTHPIFVPYGHYTHYYTFSEPGVYALDIDVNDSAYSGEIVTFTFPIYVSNSVFGYSFSSLFPLAAGIVITVIVIGGLIFLDKRRKKKTKIRTIEDTKI